VAAEVKTAEEQALAENDLWSTDYDAAMGQQASLDSKKAILDAKYARWEELISRMDAES